MKTSQYNGRAMDSGASPKPSRLHALDGVRAGAVLAVLLAHCGAAYSMAARRGVAWPVDPSAQDQLSDALVCLIRPLPMPIFFFVAGFFAAAFLGRRGPRAFIRSRLKRIGLPLLLAALTIFPLVCLVWAWGMLGQDPVVDHWIWRSHVAKLVRAEVLGPGHLWFLRDLLLLSLLYAGAVWAVRRSGRAGSTAQSLLGRTTDPQAGPPFARPPVDRLAGRWHAWVLVSAAVSAGLIWVRPKIIIGFTNTFWPHGLELAYCAVFFLAGTAYHRQDPRFVRWAGSPWGWLAGAAILFAPAWAMSRAVGANGDDLLLRAGLSASVTLYVWVGLRAVLGLAAWCIPEQSPGARWLADSTYWLYLGHLPLVGCLQILLRAAPLPGSAKMLGTFVLTVGLLLPAYHYLVRYSWLGRLLNGPRRRPAARLQ